MLVLFAAFRRTSLLLFLFVVTSLHLFCEPVAQPAERNPVASAAVTMNGKALFAVQGALSFSAGTRAAAISGRLKELSKDVTFKSQSISVSDAEGTSNIVGGDLVLMSVTDRDAYAAGMTREALAKDYAQKMGAALIAYRHEYSLKSLILGGVYALLSTVILILLLRLLGILFRQFYKKLDSWRGTLIPSLRIQKFELLPADRIADFGIGVAKLIRLALIFAICYFYASLVLGFFPWTRGYAEVLLGYVLSPLKLVGEALIAYLPNVFFIGVILLISFYLA